MPWRAESANMPANNSINIHAFVARGPRLGCLLYPHRHRDGGYAVSKTKYVDDYIYVDEPTQLLSWLEKRVRNAYVKSKGRDKLAKIYQTREYISTGDYLVFQISPTAFN